MWNILCSVSRFSTTAAFVEQVESESCFDRGTTLTVTGLSSSPGEEDVFSCCLNVESFGPVHGILLPSRLGQAHFFNFEFFSEVTLLL